MMAKPLADDAGAAVWSDVVVMLMTHGSAVTQFHRCDVVVACDVIVSTVTVDAIGSGLVAEPGIFTEISMHIDPHCPAAETQCMMIEP